MKPERLSDEQPHTEPDGINLLSVYRSMLGVHFNILAEGDKVTSRYSEKGE